MAIFEALNLNFWENVRFENWNSHKNSKFRGTQRAKMHKMIVFQTLKSPKLFHVKS